MKTIKTFFYCKKKKIPATISFNVESIFLIFPYDSDMIAEVKAMEGSSFDKIWKVKNSNRNLFAIKLLTRAKDEKITRYFSIVQDYSDKIDYQCDEKLWLHQLDMYNFILNKQRCLLAAEPRTGKTWPTLQAWYDAVEEDCCFITTSSAYLGIFREARKRFPRDVVIREQNFSLVKSGQRVINLFSYNSFQKILDHSENPPRFIVFDEIHKLKGQDSNRTNSAKKLVDWSERVYNGNEHVVGLTGTPTPRSFVDWWSQCEVIRSGFIRESTAQKFENRYTLWDDSQGSENLESWERRLGYNEEEIAKIPKRLAPLVRCYLQKDVLSLPKVMIDVIKLQPTADMLRAVNVYKRTVANVLSLRTKLHQLADGFSYQTDYNEETNKIGRTGFNEIFSPKMEQLESDLDNEETDGKGRVIVYSAFQASVDIITNIALKKGWWVLQIDGRGKFLIHYKDNEIRRDSELTQILLALDEMDRSSNKWLIPKLLFNAQTDSGGTGLELSASKIIIYYSNSDMGEGKMQSWRRAYSNNMDKVAGLTIKEYCCLPVDDKVVENHEKKAGNQAKTMEGNKYVNH